MLLGQASLRPFFLGVDPPATPLIRVSKNGGTWQAPVNTLISIGHGWWVLHVTPSDTDTIGPLCWSISSPGLLSQPQDIVNVFGEDQAIDEAAVNAALADLSLGIPPNQSYAQLLGRPCFRFLQSLL
jgi:hypothetical protein